MERVKNIVGKAENSGNQHFLLFQQFLSKALYLKSELCGKELIKRLLVKDEVVPPPPPPPPYQIFLRVLYKKLDNKK